MARLAGKTYLQIKSPALIKYLKISKSSAAKKLIVYWQLANLKSNTIPRGISTICMYMLAQSFQLIFIAGIFMSFLALDMEHENVEIHK